MEVQLQPTPQERAQYLKALDVFGEKAHQAGLEVLKRIDQKQALQAPTQSLDKQHLSAIESLALPAGVIGIGGKILKCLVKCLPHLLSGDFTGFASCVSLCFFSQ